MLGKDEAVAQLFTYVGQAGVKTEGDGLYYMQARNYVAQVGRFCSEDPIGFDGRINLHAYVGGIPVNYVAPTGFGKIGLFIRAVRGGWEKVTTNQARRRLADQGDG